MALPMYQRILVAIDGSENSKRAAQWAVDLAKKEGSSLFVVSVVPTPSYSSSTTPGATASSPVKEFMDRARMAAEGNVQDVVTTATANGTKVRGEIIENVPSVAEAITDYAEEWKVELIVVGTRGLSGFRKLLLGSVSGALISHASCSVLVVR